MAAADTARLIASLELKDKGFSKGIDNAAAKVGKLETSIGKIGGIAAQGAKTAATNLARIGVVAGAGIALAVKGGLQDLAILESAITSVDGAIAQMGLTGQVTGKQVATWANDIERDIGAAFDDKAITQAATTLIRFGDIATSNLRPALAIVADLATKTGDVDSAATLLAKALADPTKAAGKLARQGIILTKVEEDQIKALVKAGDAAGAQKVILDALTRATEGAAAASQGPYQRALSVLGDAAEDARKALAIGFLPVIEKVADLLSKELAKPQTLQNIKEFGEGLAKGLDKLIDIARGLPWATIGDSLKLAGSGAKAVLDVFTSMPSWVQSAVITGWGLNKLSGGALGGIVGELGKGLIKGVLGINAGVVNVRGAVVNGGGVPGAGGTAAAGGSASRLGTAVRVLGTVALAAGSIALIAELAGQREAQAAENAGLVTNLANQTQTFTESASIEDMKASLAGIEKAQHDLAYGSLLDPATWAYAFNIDGVVDSIDATKATLAAAITNAETTNAENARAAIDWSKMAADRSTMTAERIKSALDLSTSVTAATNRETTSAIERLAQKRQPINITTNVNVSTSVTVRDQQRKTRSAVSTGTSYGIS